MLVGQAPPGSVGTVTVLANDCSNGIVRAVVPLIVDNCNAETVTSADVADNPPVVELLVAPKTVAAVLGLPVTAVMGIKPKSVAGLAPWTVRVAVAAYVARVVVW